MFPAHARTVLGYRLVHFDPPVGVLFFYRPARRLVSSGLLASRPAGRRLARYPLAGSSCALVAVRYGRGLAPAPALCFATSGSFGWSTCRRVLRLVGMFVPVRGYFLFLKRKRKYTKKKNRADRYRLVYSGVEVPLGDRLLPHITSDTSRP